MSSKPLILITGANGQLGMELKTLGSSFPVDCIALSRQELSVDDTIKARAVFEKYHPDFLVNCAAYTAVDKAETDKESAYRVNAEAAGMLAGLCKEYKTRFIHISTDYVFDGRATRPYKEDDPVNPQSVYGASKLEGEKLALHSNADTLVIRTSWVYSAAGKNFVKTMLRLMQEKTEISVVNDQTGSPTYAADIAETILQIIGSGKWQPGIYHYSNAGMISWFDFAVAIKEITGNSCLIHPIPTSQYPTPAMRPAYSVLDTGKITRVFGIKIKDWKASLVICLKNIEQRTEI